MPDAHLRAIEARVDRGARLSADDGLCLYGHPDLEAVRSLAERVARRRNGRRVTYVVNRHINFSNVCRRSCTFCAFSRKAGEPGAYTFTCEEILDRARAAAAAGATEIHVVGGLHPTHPWEFYPNLLRRLREELPELSIKAFTAVELDYFTHLSGLNLDRVIHVLRDAGLAFVPGGGAEVLSDRVWKELYPAKAGPSRWLEIHREVHRQGLRSNATLLYGHIETVEEKVEHHLKVRALQDETGGFVSFIPLRFHPRNTGLDHLPLAGDDATLREIAVARLMLDNVKHVKAYWIMTGLDAARRALRGGADDFDGTVVEERISHMAGADTPKGLSEVRIREIIEAEGLVPFRR